MSSPTPASLPLREAPPSPPPAAPVAVAAIDGSCRWPVMFLFVCASVWLVVAALFAVIASIKLHGPGFLADCPWLTYGRVQPAAWHAFVYGFATQAALGAALWMTARLSSTVLIGGPAILLGTLFWNVGLKLGIAGLLAGHGTGVEGLELPRFATPILFVSYAGIGLGALLTFNRRQVEEVYVSQWYLLGALFSFPWVFAAAQIMGLYLPLRGVLQAAVQAWFLQNLLVLWLGFAGLAVLFYLIPKLAGRPVPSRHLALFGFWTLALFGSLAGMVRYEGGPFPSWMTSLGVVTGVITLFPVVAVGMNLWGLGSARDDAGADPAFRFARLALFAYLAAGVLGVANAFPTTRSLTQFTLVTPALDQLFLLGFVGLALLGILYHAVPSLMGRVWPASRLAGIHCSLAAGAVGLLVLAYGIGGVLQGLALRDPNLTFVMVMKRIVPFVGLGTLASMVWLAGAVLLAGQIALLMVGVCRTSCLPAAKALWQPLAAEGKA